MLTVTNQNVSETEKVGIRNIWGSCENLSKLSRGAVAWHLSGRALRNMLASPLTTGVTLVTIALALYILACFVLLVENLKHLLASTGVEQVLSIYVKDGADQKKLEELLNELRNNAEVSKVSYRSKDEALKEFRSSLGAQALILQGLESENPLPASFEIKFREHKDMQILFEKFSNKYSQSEIVEHIEYSKGIISQLALLLQGFRLFALLSIFLVLALTGFIISNTIRLALFAHKDEIEIMRLVGATNQFIRAPYMIEGALQGLLGALVSIVFVYATYLITQELFSDFALFNILSSEVHFLSWSSQLMVVISGIAVGWGGSYLATRRFMHEY